MDILLVFSVVVWLSWCTLNFHGLMARVNSVCAATDVVGGVDSLKNKS